MAAESVTFIDYVSERRATDRYAKGHIEYLSSELIQTAQELHDALPPAGTEAQFRNGGRLVDALSGALDQVRAHIDRPDELPRQRDRVAGILNSLQQEISSL